MRVAPVLVLTLLAAAACGSSDADQGGRIRVVASTNVYGSLVTAVAGDRAEVTSVISDPTQDPHSYEADPKTALALKKADVVVENGGGYDDFMDTLLASGGTSPVVLNAVTLSGKSAEGLNEHLWYDFPSMAKLVDGLVTALSEADGAGAAAFTANGDAVKARLAALEKTEAAVKATAAGRGVAVTEPVPLYLLEACGLVDRTPEEFSEAIEEGSDVPARVLKETVDLMSGGQVALLAYNEQTAGAETAKVLDAAKAHGVAVVPVTETLPAGEDYFGWMTDNLAAVQAAVST